TQISPTDLTSRTTPASPIYRCVALLMCVGTGHTRSVGYFLGPASMPPLGWVTPTASRHWDAHSRSAGGPQPRSAPRPRNTEEFLMHISAVGGIHLGGPNGVVHRLWFWGVPERVVCDGPAPYGLTLPMPHSHLAPRAVL